MRILLILYVLLSSVTFMSAQNIVGKWKCDKAFLMKLGLLYGDIHGYYKFNKGGEFLLKISGSKRLTGKHPFEYYNGREFKTSKGRLRDRLMIIKVKGKYAIKDGRITTTVLPGKVKCYIDPGYSSPIFTGKENYVSYAVKEWQDMRCTSASTVTEILERTIKTEKRGLWTWRKARMRMDGDTLVVGNFIKMVRE